MRWLDFLAPDVFKYFAYPIAAVLTVTELLHAVHVLSYHNPEGAAYLLVLSYLISIVWGLLERR